MLHQVERIGKFTVLTLLLAALLMLALTATAATVGAVIDFTGLAEGQIVSSLSVGNGISGDAISGSIAVNGVNPSSRFAGQNAAMVFDATCTGGPTGGDGDLCVPAMGNVLIVSHDLDSSDPNDADLVGAMLTFDFSGFGPGVVTVDSIDLVDVEGVEDGGVVNLYAGGALLASFPIPTTGDNQVATIAMNTAGVDFLEVVLNGSGAVDNVRISVETDETPTATPTSPPPTATSTATATSPPPTATSTATATSPPPTATSTSPPPTGGEGCTPGYWKQSHHFDSWVGYSPSDSYELVFGVDAAGNRSLLDALGWGGGGEAALARHATAALLNAANADVSYAFTTADVIATVQNAYATGEFEAAKNQLAAQNEMGCPLN